MMHYFKLNEDALVNTDCYSYYYANFKIMNYLFVNKNADLDSIYNYLEEFYGENTIDKELLYNNLIEEYDMINNHFYLSNNQEDLFKKEKRLEKYFFKFLNMDISYLNDMFFNYLYDDNKSIEIIIAYVYALANQEFEFDNETLLIKGFNLLKNSNIYHAYFDNVINNESGKDYNIKKWIISEQMKKTLINYSLNTLKSFSNKSVYFAMAVLSRNINKTLMEILKYNVIDDVNVIKDILDHSIIEYFETNKTSYYTIFTKRMCPFYEMETLEKIGESLNVTRERIRQITIKIKKVLKEKLKLNLKTLHEALYKIILTKGNYVTSNELLIYFEDEKYLLYLSYIFINDNNRIMYDKVNRIFYDKYNYNYATIKSKLRKKFNKFITLNQFKNLNEIEQNYIIQNYKKRLNNSVYAISGVKDNELILDVLDDVFKSGYKNSSNDDFELLCTKIKEIYETDYTISNIRIVSGLLERANYRNVDKGTLLNPRYAVTIEEDLKNNILYYLETQYDVVYYSSIYEKFEKELNKNGITNRYYLKGVLDEHLPSDYKPQRDYISLNKKHVTPREYIKRFVEDQKNVIYVSDLRSKFNNIEDYVFLNNISCIEDVIWLKYEEEFILARNINDINKYYDIIDYNINYLFKYLKTEIISTTKLYSRLQIVNGEMFNDLKIIDSEYAFNSYVKYLFKDKYNIVRNYISTNSEIELTGYNIVLNYAKGLKKVTSKIINDYVNKMHLPPLYSFLDFIQTISDDFVQINSEELIPKENLKITNTTLDIIKRNLDYYIDIFGCADLRKYFDYSSLPLVNFPWNKHLLVGIVRTYLNLDYDIEYTNKQYKITDYIIRRGK